jgi:thiol-disulfide isomerase/thioredoxin
MRVEFLAVIRTSLIAILLSGCSVDYGTDQHGQKVPATRVEGQWLVVNYWADWCPPCRKEVPELNLLAEQQKNQGVEVFAVNYDGLQGEDLQNAIREFDFRFTVLTEDPAARLKLPRSDGLPVTFIVDPQGRLREQLLGEQTAAGLAARLVELRKEP